MKPIWQWPPASRAYGNYGNANQWTVNAGLSSLARESAQNSNDARVSAEPADLVYTFIRLSGEELQHFRTALGWDDLVSHLRAMGAASSGAVTAGQIAAGVDAVEEADDLLLLQISDYGCAGLTGPEFPDPTLDETEYGNFIKLCRLDLYSGKDKAAGGSFGLGKAVYWRFSQLQTVVFNSHLAPGDGIDGQTLNRVLGVNQGVRHALDGAGYEGRGYFGVEDAHQDVASVWSDDDLVRDLRLERTDTRPGTTALLIGFYDPDSPERGRTGGHELVELARDLVLGIEENFWPLLTRGRLRARVKVVDEGTVLLDEAVSPADTFTELVTALEKFDAGETAEVLDEEGAVVVRNVSIAISRRKDDLPHPAFVHTAKLIVTRSDAQKDSLENTVSLIRRPEMVVQSIGREFDGITYHGFLLAGAAIRPDAPTEEDIRADDFLRYAEPPAHDRWIPGSGRSQTSQVNLTARYVAPYLPNLRAIEKSVADALFELFGTPPPKDSKGPEAVLRHLRFLKGEPGSSGTGGPPAPRRPQIELSDWGVVDGRWNVTFEISARNRPEGWILEPQLHFVGLDGRGTPIAWHKLEIVSGGWIEDGMIHLPALRRGRRVSAIVTGSSVSELPIPPAEAAIDVVLARVHTASGQEDQS